VTDEDLEAKRAPAGPRSTAVAYGPRPDFRTWFQPVRSSTGRDRIRLFCFAHAGGSASTFRPWSAGGPDGLEIHAARLPGRESRITEPPITELDELIDRLTAAIEPAVTGRFALFGHSMGALVAWELTRSLRRTLGAVPEHLFVSASLAPSRAKRDYEGLAALGDAQLLARLREMNGTPAEAMDNPELMQLVLPTVRCDFGLFADYRPAPGDVPDCPLTVLGGDRDTIVPPDALAAWAEATSGDVDIRVLAGDHFYLTDPRSDVLGIIRTRLGLR